MDASCEDLLEGYQLSPGLAASFNERFSRTPTPENEPDIKPVENSHEKPGTSTGAIPKLHSNGEASSSLSSKSMMHEPGTSTGTSTGTIPKSDRNGEPSSSPSKSMKHEPGTSTGAISKLHRNGGESLSHPSKPMKPGTSTGAIPKASRNSEASTSHYSKPRDITSPKRSFHEPSCIDKKKLKMSLEQEDTIYKASGSTVPDNGKVAVQVMTLSDMFPEADPQYLWDHCEKLRDEEAFNSLINSMLSNDNYPRVRVTVCPTSPKRAVVPSSSHSEAAPRIANGHIPSTVATVPSSSKSVAVSSIATSVSAAASMPLQHGAISTKSIPVNVGASTSRANESSISDVQKQMAGACREPWREQYETFVQILPNADPSFLEEKACLLWGKEEEIRLFVADALERQEYPSRKDWMWRQEQLALQKKYTEEFSIENFLEIIPDPFSYFCDPKRSCNKSKGEVYLRNKYRTLKVFDIKASFMEHQYNLTLTCRALDDWKGPTLKSRRGQQGEYDITKNEVGKGIDVPFLQEVAFIENESKIVQYLEDKKQRRKRTFDEAKAKGELLQCQCCFDDEILAEDTRTCTEGHLFCVSCVQKGSEQRIGEGHSSFPCLTVCTAEFTLQTLQEILKPTVFSRMVQRKQAEEVKAAGIEDLVQCPFCDFCNIPPKEDKVFRCLNPDCMKESCRLCKEENHIPLRCDEVEKKTEVEMRTYIENKMTEALVRTCWQCQKKFVKEDGCNKMTCQCGALMCYVCRQPVKDYTHFNGQGGDAYQKCPLYSDHHALEAEEVKKIAEQAKREALAMKPNVALKHDPTKLLPVYRPRPQQDEYDGDDYDSEDYDSEFSDEDDVMIVEDGVNGRDGLDPVHLNGIIEEWNWGNFGEEFEDEFEADFEDVNPVVEDVESESSGGEDEENDADGDNSSCLSDSSTSRSGRSRSSRSTSSSSPDSDYDF